MSASSPVGIIIPNLPVQTNPVAISPTQFAFTFPALLSSTHVVVFLLPEIKIPLDTLAAIYINFPNSPGEFKLLGALSNEKQSAIFPIANGIAENAGSLSTARGSSGGGFTDDEMIDDESSSLPNNPLAGGGGGGSQGDITIGISIEPVATIAPQLAVLESEQAGLAAATASSTTSAQTAMITSPKRPVAPLQTKVLAQRIIKNAFNFLASFSGTVGSREEEMVPLKSFMDWWAKFERRIENDPGFLEKDIDG